MDEPHDCRTACRELALRMEDLEAEKAELELLVEQYQETIDDIANALEKWTKEPKETSS